MKDIQDDAVGRVPAQRKACYDGRLSSPSPPWTSEQKRPEGFSLVRFKTIVYDNNRAPLRELWAPNRTHTLRHVGHG